MEALQDVISARALKDLVGEVDERKIVEILKLSPSAADVEEAAIWAGGDGHLLAKEGHPLTGTAAQIFDILTADADDSTDRCFDITPLAGPRRKTSTIKNTFPQPLDCPVGMCSSISMYERELVRHKATEAKLRAFAIRERRLLLEKDELIQQKDMLAKESEHRLLNGLQLITSLLTFQSRAANNVEASAELKIAANRVATLGRVHQHLHALDHVESVAFKHYLETLCHDLAGVASTEDSQRDLVVAGDELNISSAKAIPLGFIASELLTNSIKYAKGKVTVRLETTSKNRHVLSISDDGPGLPEGFDPAHTHGLGMKLISALVKQIGGELRISKGDNGQGARFAVLFCDF